MRNGLILGSARSGTSMVAGLFGKAGYHMGEQPIAGSQANPKGFFEDREINSINEVLLAPVTQTEPHVVPGEPEPHPVYGWQRWLAPVPVGTHVPCPSQVAKHIEARTAETPFCFKDPRLCYTLPAWRPFLEDTTLVCVFREPEKTARSIVNFCENDPYLYGLSLSVDLSKATEVWTLMYRHILEAHKNCGEWLFVHYDQALDGSAIPRLEWALEAEADRSFPDPDLKRSPGGESINRTASEVYRRLCELAEFTG